MDVNVVIYFRSIFNSSFIQDGFPDENTNVNDKKVIENMVKKIFIRFIVQVLIPNGFVGNRLSEDFMVINILLDVLKENEDFYFLTLHLVIIFVVYFVHSFIHFILNFKMGYNYSKNNLKNFLGLNDILLNISCFYFHILTEHSEHYFYQIIVRVFRINVGNLIVFYQVNILHFYNFFNHV